MRFTITLSIEAVLSFSAIFYCFWKQPLPEARLSVSQLLVLCPRDALVPVLRVCMSDLVRFSQNQSELVRQGWNSGSKARIGIATLILTGYSLLLCLVVAPDAPAGASPLSYEGNLVGYIDRCLYPNHLHQHKFFDPEGLLSTLPAIVTAMPGMFTGELLRSSNFSGNRKTIYMIAASAALIAIGLAWSTVMPINTKLWSSSFVCVVAGYSVAMWHYSIG